MTAFEAWIADCQLKQFDGTNEYQCHAIVWADSYDTFRDVLVAYLERKGLGVLWFDEVLPAEQYLLKYDLQRQKIQEFVREVHFENPVAIRDMVVMHHSENPDEVANYLTIREINGVEPLGLQMGNWPIKTVPDILHEPLFGQPEPSAEEISQYGGLESVPSMKTYAILNAEKFQWGASEIEEAGLPYRCLFKGQAAIERKDEAPFLIELSLDAEFTQRLFTYDPDKPHDMTSVHLWHKEPGMYVRSRADIDVLWHHFRRFTRFQKDGEKWFHFHFWEGWLFPDYWRHFATSYERVARFLCSRDFTHDYQICYLHKGVFTQISPDLVALRAVSKPVPPFALTAEDYAFFQGQIDARFKSKIKSRLVQKLNAEQEDEKVIIPRAVDGAFEYIKRRNRGALVHEKDCFTLALLALLWRDAAKEILRGPVLNEPLVPIGQRIELAKASYFEALETLKD